MPALVTCELTAKTADPKDSALMSFAFADVGGGDAFMMAEADLEGKVFEFFNEPIGATTRAIRDYISNDRASMILRIYSIDGHLDGSPHGSPVKEVEIGTVGWGTTQPLPSQVAAVLSLHSTERDTSPVETPDGGDAGTQRDRPMERRTGRLFVGPLNVSCLAAATGSGQAIFSEQFRGDLLTAAARLRNDALADNDASWCVWSRKDAALRAIDHAVMDNSPDTIRGRKFHYTVRTNWSLGAE